MILPNLAFAQNINKVIDPLKISSGTEYMAPLLYTLIRMTRSRTVVELGSGYSTFFILQALSENRTQIDREMKALRKKTIPLGDLNHLDLQNRQHKSLINEWLNSEGDACNVDPRYYLAPYDPHLYCYESLTKEDPYVKNMATWVEENGYMDTFTYIINPIFYYHLIPADRLPVDLVFNDDVGYKESFEKLWPLLNPNGGVFIFHNVPALEEWWQAIEWMRESRSKENDIEVLILEEPHKYNQNGCAILRKNSGYKPSFRRFDVENLHQGLQTFMKETKTRVKN